MVLVKVFDLRKNNYNHSDPRISCIMLNKIAAMYRDLKQKETLQSSLVIKNLNSPTSSCVIRHSIHINLQNCTSQETYNKFHHTYKTSIIDCHNCGTVIRLDLIQMEYVWRWYALIIYSQVTVSGGQILVKEHHYVTHRPSLTRTGRQCFTPSVLVHQITHYNQDIHYNTPND